MDNSTNQDLVNRLNLLLEVNATINSTRNLSDLLTKITNTTSIVMRAEASSIALLDAAANELVFQFVHGEFSNEVKTVRIPVGSGISGWVANYGVPLIIPDAQKDPRFNNTVDKKTTFITKSVICVPLKREEKVTGILQSLNKKDDGVFTNEDLAIFESLANIASIAIENAQLYEMLSQKLQQLEEAKQRNEHILNKLKQSEDEMMKLKELSDNSGVFSGSLEIFRVENLVQMLGNDYKTGRLSLVNKSEKAYIYLQNGKLKHAELEGRPLKGLNAFYETICWTQGKFFFDDGITQPSSTIDKMAMSIVIEGLRRFDESNSLLQKYTLDIVPKYAFDSEVALSEPSPEDTPKVATLKTIDGTRTLDQILKLSIFDRYSVLTSIKELEDDKMISF